MVDLIFDTAATRLDPSYIDLIKRFDFPPSTVSAIVGMKLGGLGRTICLDEYIEGLFLAIALAIQAKIFDLEDILPYLSRGSHTRRLKKRKHPVPWTASQHMTLVEAFLLIRVNSFGYVHLYYESTPGYL